MSGVWDPALKDSCRIIMESAELVMNTVNPETRNGRLALMDQHLEALRQLDKQTDKSRHTLVRQARKLAKIARKTPPKWMLLQNPASVIVCYSVYIPDSDRVLLYLSHGTKYHRGNIVIVPFGDNCLGVTGIVVCKETYTASDMPCPIKKLKYIRYRLPLRQAFHLRKWKEEMLTKTAVTVQARSLLSKNAFPKSETCSSQTVSHLPQTEATQEKLLELARLKTEHTRKQEAIAIHAAREPKSFNTPEYKTWEDLKDTLEDQLIDLEFKIDDIKDEIAVLYAESYN